MPSRRTPKKSVILDDEPVEQRPGSGQSPESLAADVAAQRELLEAAAAHNSGASSSKDVDKSKSAGSPSGPGAKKKKKRKLTDLAGFADLASGNGSGSGSSGKKKEKPIVAEVKAAKHMQGEKKNQDSGNFYYAINCVYEENKALQEVIEKCMHGAKARFFSDWGKWATKVRTASIANMLHSSIRADPNLKQTAAKLNAHLDTTPFESSSYVVPSFVLAESEAQFETRADGLLPRSILIIGKHTYDFKEFLKAKFPEIRYLDLIFNGGTVTKAGWVLPTSAQSEPGALADYLRELGADVTEEDLDEGDDDSEEDDERDDEALVDGEAEEADEDEDEGDEDK